MNLDQTNELMKIKFYIFVSLYLLVLFIYLYSLYPNIDILTSSFFFNNESGFFLKNIFLAKLFYYLVPIFLCLSLAYIFVHLLYIYFKPKFLFKIKDIFQLSKRDLVFILSCIILIPGILVNGILKEYSGRARPSQIKEFSGPKNFSMPFIISDQCNSNCSFVAGHPSMAFTSLSIALVIRKNKIKRKAIIISLLFGFFSGLFRIIQGGHFFSDVISSTFITCLSILLIYYFFYKNCNIVKKN